ncbi:L-aspartate oxidase [Flavobacterium sp. WV_118_3]|uniref:L-aspartate oxidase n=1 Tax=Flavobacterium sp. WV_118_3 TaxID=3151764 RepID=UPI003219756B
MEKTDILIAGSGISGLFFAIKMAKKRPDLSITILTKASADSTNTRYAQGGIAVVTNTEEDSFEQHIRDTLQAGGGSCDTEIVRMVVEQAPERLQELLNLQVDFDTTVSGAWDLGLEGGHSHHRILHHKDQSGLEMERKLLCQLRQYPNIVLFEDYFSIDLTTENNSCTGMIYYDKIRGTVKHIRSRITVLCTGGCGQLFQNTTNPEIATGDGVAMAFRAGAVIKDMQYIQFHPTALYETGKNPLFLLSEAVRGFGAHIINHNYERFLYKYDTRGELATRDIISKAIGSELHKTGEKYVFLDCRHLNAKRFYEHFPSITDYCLKSGFDPAKEPIPIVPAAHYQCGGIQVDKNARTTIQNLYAVGECAQTGLHGKNRLASNSLLEALVFAHQGMQSALKTIDSIRFSTVITLNQQPISCYSTSPSIKPLKALLQKTMTAFFTTEASDINTVRNTLKKLKQKADSLFKNHDRNCFPTHIEFRNMLTVSMILLEHSHINTPEIESFTTS